MGNRFRGNRAWGQPQTCQIMRALALVPPVSVDSQQSLSSNVQEQPILKTWGQPTWRTVRQLCRATPGRTGLDLGLTSRFILTSQMGPQSIPSGLYGPLPPTAVGLFLGRSSWTIKGLQVFPAVIDSDYTGEIKFIAGASRDIIQVLSTDRIAQIVLIPTVTTGGTASQAGVRVPRLRVLRCILSPESRARTSRFKLNYRRKSISWSH